MGRVTNTLGTVASSFISSQYTVSYISNFWSPISSFCLGSINFLDFDYCCNIDLFCYFIYCLLLTQNKLEFGSSEFRIV